MSIALTSSLGAHPSNSVRSEFTSVDSNPSISAFFCAADEQLPCPFNTLPEELISHIFRLLVMSNLQDFYHLSAVSRTFSILSKTVPLPIPEMAFGKAKWAIYFVVIGEEPPLPPNIYYILDSPCPVWEGKKIRDTHLLILVPRTVNGQLLTLSRLGELVKNPKMGHPTCYCDYYPDGNENTQASENYWILMTKDIILRSQGKLYHEQRVIVRELASRSRHPYEVPRLIEAATAIFMHYVETGERLYRDNPWTFTRCQEQTKRRDRPMVVGGFTADGLNVRCDYYISHGVGGVWKL